ncbi:MAG: hypothetical protein ACK4S4_15575 [Pyrinomonadaceae bacterium]
MTNTQTKTIDHARQNAAGWYSSIDEMVAALDIESAAGRYAAGLSRERCIKLLAGIDIECSDEQPDEDLRDAVAENLADGTLEIDDFEFDEDAARQTIEESPLSIEVRSGWCTPGETMGPEEYSILLSTGGPALRLIGDLDQHNEPETAELQYQDWGTPWTPYHDENVDEDVLIKYAQCFYFGE